MNHEIKFPADCTYKVGDIIEAEKPETGVKMSGPLVAFGTRSVGIEGLGWPLQNLIEEGFTIRKIGHVLPKAVGSIVKFDREQKPVGRMTDGFTGGVAVRTGTNGWKIAGELGNYGNQHVAAFTGLTVVLDAGAE